MKFTQPFCLTSIVIFCLLGHSICAPSQSGSGALIAYKFDQIDQTIQELDATQKQAGNTGPADFSKASVLLIRLSRDAEEAKDGLDLMYKTKLDDGSSQKIGKSLVSSADHVVSITEMVKKGKTYFEQQHVTQTVVQILQTDVGIFRDLFNALNDHSNANYLASYKPQESRFICQMISAIQVLDPSKVSPSDAKRCASHNYFATNDDGLGTVPPGWKSCGGSPSSFFTSAYSTGTIGTSNIDCQTSVSPSEFVVPSNPLNV